MLISLNLERLIVITMNFERQQMKDYTIEDIYQNFSPKEKDFPFELMEHLCAINNMELTENVKHLIQSVYAETKYRVLMEGLTP
jgi:hypothetical protein